ncbi:MAG TPA: murein biosynthesis integral membrane protein MurJ [Actinophytocola sp.]|uniref:murein biosynthesis integral membrane protein MurJ n=1 Tax=Actinophytocola sp. TaxID=1872138 RepID=UPI002DDDA1C0|nr:murein biosynthesis integral membrane protein MurJ [Actinophytocola sp.]HEV2778493.1 murein biosynthesis integral membrane protein MurJ [Actinophytocola sp.]
MTRGARTDSGPSLARSSGSLAIATLVSRITGFGWKVVLAWVVGFSVVNDSFTVASNFPTIINELLLGGVLTSVVVPLLVRAQKEDPDGGQAYTQRLLTVGFVVLLTGTVIAIFCAPLLTAAYTSDSESANPALTTAFTYLMLPAIVFLGLSAMLMAILNSKQRFAATGWAPVLNNVVMFVVIGLYAAMPGDITLDPVRMGDAKLLVLGLGFPVGIASQLLVLVPALRRSGFRFRWRWGWDRRLAEFGGLALWVVAYTLLGQLGLSAVTNAATSGAAGGAAIYSSAWLLLQFPYGVIGVSLLTVIMPRMSAAAADGDYRGVIDDLSLGSRLSIVLLGPLCALMTVLGPQIGIALYSIGNAGPDATRLGLAITASAFGVLPYAIVMLQLRVFYAMKDARTPTLIMVIMMAVKVPLTYLCPQVLEPRAVVYGLTFVNSLTYVVGMIVGELWLRSRLGRLGTGTVLRTLIKTLVAATWGAGVALALALLFRAGLGPQSAAGAWLSLILGTLAGGLVMFGLMTLLRVREAGAVTDRITRLVRRR